MLTASTATALPSTYQFHETLQKTNPAHIGAAVAAMAILFFTFLALVLINLPGHNELKQLKKLAEGRRRAINKKIA